MKEVSWMKFRGGMKMRWKEEFGFGFLLLRMSISGWLQTIRTMRKEIS
jgi:hypothetical protein